MSKSGTQFPANEIHPLTGRIEESVTARASQVKTLIRKRRKIALRFRRTRDARDRAELEQIDEELAQHHIDIPAVQEQVAMRKKQLVQDKLIEPGHYIARHGQYLPEIRNWMCPGWQRHGSAAG